MRKIKAFGQHFLNDQQIAQRITDLLATDESESENEKQTNKCVVEIGPGEGVLTKYLLKRTDIDSLYLIEIDQRLPAELEARYPSLSGKIICADVLKLPFEDYIKDNFSVIGNFPYNISTEILFKVIEYKHQITQVVGMFQKEVAERVAAKAGGKEYGVTSVLIQAYYDVSYRFTVEPSSFDPPPKVKSGVLRLTRTHQHETQIKHQATFKNVVKQAFGQRRKMLSNALAGMHFDKTQIDPNIWQKRAEQLSISDFILLANAVIR